MRQNYLDQEVTAGMLKLTFGTCDNGVVTWQIYMSSVIIYSNRLYMQETAPTRHPMSPPDACFDTLGWSFTQRDGFCAELDPGQPQLLALREVQPLYLIPAKLTSAGARNLATLVTSQNSKTSCEVQGSKTIGHKVNSVLQVAQLSTKGAGH